jgi:hypothetical protein
VEKKRVLTAFIISALLFSAVAGTMFANLAEADPIPAPTILQMYIRSDGIVEPSTAPIQRTGNIYTFKSALTNSSIEVQCDNIIIDGAGFTLQGNGQHWNTGITLTNRSNVIIKNIDIKDYWKSITLTESSNIIIYHNSMLTAWNIILDSSTDNQIVGNNITAQETGYGYCITFDHNSSSNLITGNNLHDAGVAVHRNNGKNNTFYRNNFVNNSNNVVGGVGDKKGNFWDNGTEGNFWSDYQGTDADGDGIGDTPYVIDDERQDRHPLMAPFDIDSVVVEMPEWANTTDSAEPFPTTLVIASVITVAIIGVGSLVYYKKRKR